MKPNIPLHQRLSVRLMAAFIVVTLVAVFTAALVAGARTSTEFRYYLTRRDLATFGASPEGLFNALASYFREYGNWSGVSVVFNQFGRAPGMAMGRGGMEGRGRPPMTLADRELRIVYDERGARIGQLLNGEERAIAQRITLRGDEIVGYVVLTPRGPMTADDENFLTSLRDTLLIAGLAAGVTGIGLGLLISRTLTTPLRRLAEAARDFAAHNWGRRVKIEAGGEVAEVGRAFNAMADALQRAEQLRRDMMADIAHELRTPLSVMQGTLRALIDGIYPLEQREIAILYDETRLLNRLVDDLRELALAESGQLPLYIRPVDPKAILTSTLSNFAAAADARSIELTLEAGEPLPDIQADPDRLAQVLSNLLTNAIRHAPEGSVTLAARPIEGAVEFSVRDTGQGIPPEDLPHVFDRFYRGQNGRAGSGIGLGLAIARTWVEAMGGQIGVQSDGTSGTRFWFTLPRAHTES